MRTKSNKKGCWIDEKNLMQLSRNDKERALCIDDWKNIEEEKQSQFHNNDKEQQCKETIVLEAAKGHQS